MTFRLLCYILLIMIATTTIIFLTIKMTTELIRSSIEFEFECNENDNKPPIDRL